jgi:predicted ester cyclase
MIGVDSRGEGSSPMPITTSDAHAMVAEFFDAMNDRELDRLDAIVAANFVRHCQATPEVDVRSLDDFKAFLNAYTAVFPDNVQTPIQIAADGDLIGIFATYEGTHLGAFGGFEPTGKRAQFDFAGMLKVEDGKLSEWWITWDNMTILAQLGLLPGSDGA